MVKQHENYFQNVSCFLLELGVGTAVGLNPNIFQNFNINSENGYINNKTRYLPGLFLKKKLDRSEILGNF